MEGGIMRKKQSERNSAETTGRACQSAVGRRGFLRLVSLGTLGFGFGVSIFDSIFQSAGSADRSNDLSYEAVKHMLLSVGTVDFMGFRAKEVTPNNEFYITTYSDKVPAITLEAHTLRIEGLVEQPYTLTMKDIETMKDTTEYVTLQCIGNPVGGDAIGNAFWEGVTLKKILDKARPKTGILKAVFFAGDGYSDSIPYALAQSGDVFLAYKMNGEPLPRQHGYPLRAVVPGIYGMKNVKWISKIELVNYDFKGYWEKQGWSDEAIMPIKSQILMPMSGKTIPLGNYAVGGVAFAGRYGITRVQVSVDGGTSWADAGVKKPLSNWAWSLWEHDWKPTHSGEYSIRVRGIDRSGKVQESGSLLGRLTGSYPSGAVGIHQVNVTAK
jgi:hypothetical protein